MEYPFVSIIVPAYNSERTISDCIKSLLEQDYPKDRYEIIVVDNASTDSTAELIKCHPVQYILNDTVQTSYSSRNRGIEASKGAILAFTDADCIADSTWVPMAVGAFDDPKVGCVAGGIKSSEPENYVEEYLHQREFMSQKESHKFFDFLPFAQTANAFYRKDVFDRVGKFKDEWKSAGDADLSWRMQLETDLKLEFYDPAVVTHRHRTTLDGLYKQFKTHGEGQANLYKCYSKNLERYSFKQSIYILFRLIRSLFLCHGINDSKLRKMPPEKRKYSLSTLIFKARTLGRLQGGLKNGIFFI